MFRVWSQRLKAHLVRIGDHLAQTLLERRARAGPWPLLPCVVHGRRHPREVHHFPAPKATSVRKHLALAESDEAFIDGNPVGSVCWLLPPEAVLVALAVVAAAGGAAPRHVGHLHHERSGSVQHAETSGRQDERRCRGVAGHLPCQAIPRAATTVGVAGRRVGPDVRYRRSM